MSIAETIETDARSAMKTKDEPELSTLRLVRSALKNKEIELGKELKDEDVLAVLKTMKKQYLDALSDFEKAGRTDLVEGQKKELAVLDRYLPAALSEAELERIVKEAVLASGASDAAAFGKAMAAAMKAVEGRADGNAVRAVVQRLLAPSTPSPASEVPSE
jgi:uncharacterized protein YqeY